jgi:hypothetical protein
LTPTETQKHGKKARLNFSETSGSAAAGSAAAGSAAASPWTHMSESNHCEEVTNTMHHSQADNFPTYMCCTLCQSKENVCNDLNHISLKPGEKQENNAFELFNAFDVQSTWSIYVSVCSSEESNSIAGRKP